MGKQGRRDTLCMAAKYEHKGGVLQSSAQGSRRGAPEPRCNSFDEQKVGTDPTESNLLTTFSLIFYRVTSLPTLRL